MTADDLRSTTARRAIGSGDLRTGAVGLGCVTFGREIDEEASRRVLDHAVERGITLLDTAEAYGGGNARRTRLATGGHDRHVEATEEMHSSELILGRWMRARGCREEVIVCTKVSSGNGPENIRRQVAASLERLQIDRIDVYELHSPDAGVPIEESLDALDREVAAGRIRVIGASNLSAAQMREALDASDAGGFARFQVTQPPYSLVDRRFEGELFPLCEREGVAVTTYSPLGAGFLTGKYSTGRGGIPSGSRFDIAPGHVDIYFTEENFAAVDRLRERAESLGVPMVRLAMAWAMGHPAVTAVLIGARTTDHVDNALAAVKVEIPPAMRAVLAGEARRSS